VTLPVTGDTPANGLARTVAVAVPACSPASVSSTTDANVTTGCNAHIRADDAPALVVTTSAVVVATPGAAVLASATVTARVGGTTRTNEATRGAPRVHGAGPLALSLRRG